MIDQQAPSEPTPPGTASDFALEVLPLVEDPSFETRSGEEVLSTLDQVYKSRSWDPDVADRYATVVEQIRRAKNVEADLSPLDKALAAQPLPVDLQVPVEQQTQDREKLAKDIDTWRDGIKANLAQEGGAEWLRIKVPAEKEIDQIADYAKRYAFGEGRADTFLGKVGDLAARVGEGGATFVTRTLGLDSATEAVEDYFREDPNTDEEYLSQLAGGIGQFFGQVGGTAGSYAAGFAVGGPPGAIVGGIAFNVGSNAKLTFEEAYDEAYDLTASESMAMEAGLRSLPGATLDGVVDYFLAKGITGPWIKGLSPTLKAKALTRLAIAQRTAGAAARGGLTEGATEAAQSAVTDLAVSEATGFDTFSSEDVLREGAVGAGVGVIGGGIGGLRTGLRDKAVAIQSEARAKAEAIKERRRAQTQPKQDPVPEEPIAEPAATPEPAPPTEDTEAAQEPTFLTPTQQEQFARRLDEFYHSDEDEVTIDGVTVAQIPAPLLDSKLTNIFAEDTEGGVILRKRIPEVPKPIQIRKTRAEDTESLDSVQDRISYLEEILQNVPSANEIEEDIREIQSELTALEKSALEMEQISSDLEMVPVPASERPTGEIEARRARIAELRGKKTGKFISDLEEYTRETEAELDALEIEAGNREIEIPREEIRRRRNELKGELARAQAEFEHYHETRDNFRLRRKAMKELDGLYQKRTRLENPELAEQARIEALAEQGVETMVEGAPTTIADSENFRDEKTPTDESGGFPSKRISKAQPTKAGARIVDPGTVQQKPSTRRPPARQPTTRRGRRNAARNSRAGRQQTGAMGESFDSTTDIADFRETQQEAPSFEEKRAGEYSTVLPLETNGVVIPLAKRPQPQNIPSVFGEFKNTKDLIKQASTVFYRSILMPALGTSRTRGVLGQYFPGLAKVFVRFSGDLDTALHELAHGADDKLRIGGILLDEVRNAFGSGPSDVVDILKKFPILSELFSLAPHGSGGPTRSLRYNIAEGMAEYMRGFVLDSDYMRREFPLSTVHFELNTTDEFRDDLVRLGDEIGKLFGAQPLDLVRGLTSWAPDGKWQIAMENIRNLFGTTAPADEFAATGLDRWRKRWTDSFHPARIAIEFVRKTKGITSLLPEMDPEVLSRLYLGFNSKYESILNYGMIDARGDRVTQGGFSEVVLGSLDKSSAEALNTEMQIMAAVGLAQRTIEKSMQRMEQDMPGSQFKRVMRSIGPISGFGAGPNVESKGRTDMDVAVGVLNEFATLPQEQQDRINQALEGYRQWADTLLRYMVEKGRMSQDAYEEIKANNEYYMAMYRVMDDAGVEAIHKGSGAISDVMNPLRRFRGSGRQIRNPLENLLEATYHVVKEADRNRVMASFTDLLSQTRGMYEGEPQALGSVGWQVDGTDAEALVVYKNGQKEYWRFAPDIQETLETYAEIPGTHSLIGRVMQNLTHLLKFGVSYSPAFAMRNRMRDIQHRLVVSRSGGALNYEGLLAEFKRRGGAMEAETLKVNGGDQAGHYYRDRVDFHRALNTAVKELLGMKNFTIFNPATYWAGYKQVIENSERSGRLAEFRAAKEKALAEGMDEYNANLYAAFQARDLMDFAVAGTVMKVINRYIPYSNAGIQALRRSVRAANEDWTSFATRSFVYAILPAMMVRGLAESGGYEDEYKQLPPYLRDLFFNVKVGPNTWVSIPKNYETSIFSAFAERAYDWAIKGDTTAWEGYIGHVVNTLAPFDEGSFAGPLRPLIEAGFNYDSFRGKTIVPHWEAGKDLERRRAAEGASRLGQGIQSLAETLGLGDTTLGRRLLDARTTDHLLRGFFGNLGGLLIQATDVGRDEGGNPLTLSKVTGVVRQTPVWGSRDVQYVFNYASRRGVHPQDKRLESLKTLIDMYFDAETDEEKDKAGQRVMKHAARIRDSIEAYGDRAFGLKANTR